MNLKIFLYGFLFVIFAAGCSEQVLESDPLTNGQADTNNLKSATIGTKYFVAKTGSNSNSGSLTAPFLTIQKAADVAVAGDTVFVRGGVYQEQVTFSNSGTSSSRIVIRPYQSETAVLDGNSYSIPTGDYDYLVRLYGNYITISGLEIRNSHASALYLHGTNNLADGIYAHHNFQSGIYVDGDYGTVQKCTTSYNCQNNNGGTAPLNGSGISAARSPNFVTLKNNLIFENWGEGLSTFEANGTILEDNTVYDNWSANIYLSDATNISVKRNFVYRTKDMTNGSQVGILLGDEKISPASYNITIANNIVHGCKRNLYYWGSNGTNGMNTVLITNNTFVNSVYFGSVQLNDGPHSGVNFNNNIVCQNGGLLPIYMVANSGLHFSNNLWSNAPYAAAKGTGDIIGDPKFVNTTLTCVTGSYNLSSTSPAIDAGASSGLTTDFSKNAIVGLPDIGACEYSTPKAVVTTYYNAQSSATATKNDCGTGYTGSTVTYTVPASKYSSTISQADADSKALTDLTGNKQAYANANGSCTAIPPTVYYNAQVSSTAIKSDCGSGYTGSTVTYVVSAGKFSSTVSQSDADAKAQADLNNNKQTYANANGSCTAIPVTVYYNTAISGTATKNSCGTNYKGSKVTYVVAAGKYSSTISQADADSKAVSDLNANKQAYANANGTCTALKIYQRRY